jgi:hypothetical protein
VLRHSKKNGIYLDFMYGGPDVHWLHGGRRGVVHSQPSFDGNYMSDRDRETGNLVVRDIATGKERMLTKTDPNWFAYESLISPENKRVAFLQFNPYFNLDAWSPDGRYIFGRLERKPMQLVRVFLLVTLYHVKS